MSVVCLAREFSEEDQFTWACNLLKDLFVDVSTMSIQEAELPTFLEWTKKNKPSLIFTNLIGLCPMGNFLPVVLYVTNDNFFDVKTKRLLTLPNCKVDVFCNSVYNAQHVYNQTKIKSRIQYPCIPDLDDHSDIKNSILFSADSTDFIDELQYVFPNETFEQYERYENLTSAKMYIHLYKEPKNIERVLLATSLGIPCISINTNIINEFSLQNNTLLSHDTPIWNWEQSVKNVLRDREILAKMAKDSRKKYNNLDLLVDRVKKEAILRAAQKQQVPQGPKSVSPIKPTRAYIRKTDQLRRSLNSVKSSSEPPVSLSKYYHDLKSGITKKANFDKADYRVPHVSIMPMPSWFITHRPIDVSIVIPMFNSKVVIEEQIRSWDLTNDGISKEIIYVDDHCPQNSYESVLKGWTSVKEKRDREKGIYPKGFGDEGVGKLLRLNSNSGYATACNVGAQHSSGKYIIFLNSDTIVTPGWVKPMYDLMEENNKIGITGNLHLKKDGSIDSAGSEWMKDTNSFEHIGRNVLHGKRLSKVIYLNNAPQDILQPSERQMVTGCCFMIKRELFNDLGGFDIGYRIGYWEDADLNMRVKEKGYKIFYQPKSIIYHRVGHSGALGHPFTLENTKRFHDKWIKTGKINELIGGK